MKEQASPHPSDSENRGKTGRREFLDTMNDLIPWEEWVALIRPTYAAPPGVIRTLLRMYLLQAWYSLSDGIVLDTMMDSEAMRKFMGDEFGRETAPEAETLLQFRERLEENFLGRAIFDSISRALEKSGQRLCGGIIAEAVIMKTPSSDEK